MFINALALSLSIYLTVFTPLGLMIVLSGESCASLVNTVMVHFPFSRLEIEFFKPDCIVGITDRQAVW